MWACGAGWAWFSGREDCEPRLLRGLASAGPVQSISAGAHHSLAVAKGGATFGWGGNRWWQLGLGDTRDVREPREVWPRPRCCLTASAQVYT